jgi:hypothetical protein
MVRSVIAALALVFVTSTAGADDKVKKPIGTWVREAGENKITFVFKDKTVTATVKLNNAELVVEASYEATKDGEIKSTITKIVKNDVGMPLEEGFKFSFKHKIEDGKMTVSDLKVNDGQDAEEAQKSLVEGDYKKEKEKKEEKKEEKK